MFCVSLLSFLLLLYLTIILLEFGAIVIAAFIHVADWWSSPHFPRIHFNELDGALNIFNTSLILKLKWISLNPLIKR